MSWIWPILAMLVVTMWVLAFVDIARRRHAMSGVEIAAWVIVLIVLPVLGAAAYFVVRALRDPTTVGRALKLGGSALAISLFGILGIFVFSAVWVRVGLIAAVVVIVGGLYLISSLVERSRREPRAGLPSA
jgi:Phospholipase_D-nuclease N-terminal